MLTPIFSALATECMAFKLFGFKAEINIEMVLKI